MATPPPASQRSSAVESFKVMDVLQRANELQASGKKVYHLEVGQPESGAPPLVAQAAQDALKEGATMGYTDAFGLLSLRQKIADFYSTKYQASIRLQNIVITTGSSGAFLLAFTGCFDAGDTVAIASSGYPCYRNILQALGCRLCSIEINSEFKLTAKELKQAIESRTKEGLPPIKGLILSSPSNPTGAMLTPEELKDLCQVCDDQMIHFLSDEIYHGISYGMPEATAITYSSNAFVINSFSKYYSSTYGGLFGYLWRWQIPSHIPFLVFLSCAMFLKTQCLGGDWVGW